jgi:PAS domain S-box-containing protein
MEDSLKILLLEDSAVDAEIIHRFLQKEITKFEFRLAMNKRNFIETLEQYTPDVILSDNSLPQFNASEALAIVRNQWPHLPFILVTGTVSEEYAAGIIKQGADDYILKDRMTRLPAAIETALKQRRIMKEITDYRYAMDQSAIIAITDQTGIITYANENFCRISGYTTDELIGEDHRIINSGYHPDSYIRNLWVTIAHGKIWKGEFRNKAKDGTYYWVDTTIVPFLNEKNKPYQYLSIRTDITKKKKAEENLRRSELSLKEAQAITHISNWEIDYQQKVHRWSDEYYRIFGIGKEDVIPSAETFLAFIHPDDAAMSQKIVSEALNDYKDASLTFRFIRKDGAIRFGYSEWNFEFDKKEKPLRLFGILQDITEQKEAEIKLEQSFREKQALAERMSIILNTLPANIALLDNDGIIIEVNNSWKNFADDNGFTGKNYGIGDNYLDISNQSFGEEEDDGKTVAAGILKVLQHTTRDFVFEYACHSPDKQRWFRMVVTPLQEKEYNGVVVMHVDITQLRRLEHERMESKVEEQRRITEAILNAQEKERNSIGTELHDNVNQILVGTNLLLTMVRSEPQKVNDFISACIDNIQLAISENRKIAHELVAPNQDKEPLLIQIRNLSANMLEKAGMETRIMHRNFSEEKLNKEQKLAVYRILQEQCTNIIKYAEAKSVVLMLSTTNTIFRLTIADDGKGMDKEKTVSGIGLRNIESRLNVFSGEMSVESEPGKGFILEITIPLS